VRTGTRYVVTLYVQCLSGCFFLGTTAKVGPRPRHC